MTIISLTRFSHGSTKSTTARRSDVIVKLAATVSHISARDETGSASIAVAALNERGSSHSLTACRESRDGLPGGAYEFWARSRSSVNG